MNQRIVLLLFCLCAAAAPITAHAVNKPDWPLEVLSWDIDKAYPGIEYNYRVAVKGGEYPYQFTLVEGPSGMTINKKTGEILWTPASSLTDTVVVRISDMAGNSLVHQFDITSTKTGFYFVDGAKGSDTSNTGSESSPWKTMKHASATADSSSYVYVKKGTYNETFSIASKNCGRFMAYPGDAVVVIGGFSINGGEKRLFQGFAFDGNMRRWLFSVDGYAKNLIWRKNNMHTCGSTDRENPAFIFFWNDSGNPIKGLGGYDNVVIHENVFYDLRDPESYHCASVTTFDVQDMLYEDNVAYDIDGAGIKDKDMGYMNTIRNNVIYDCNTGISLTSQGGQSKIEVSYNHVYNCSAAFNIGSDGYINNAFVHHNTLLGAIKYGGWLDNPTSGNINMSRNIIGNGNSKVHVVPAIKDTNINRYYYPDYFTTANYDIVQIDSNLVWSVEKDIVGPGWGIPAVSWSAWQAWGFDKSSILRQLELDSNHIPILPDSLKIYGHFGANTDVNHAPVLAPIGSRSVPAGQPVQFTVQGTDADGDVLQFGASGGGR